MSVPAALAAGAAVAAALMAGTELSIVAGSTLAALTLALGGILAAAAASIPPNARVSAARVEPATMDSSVPAMSAAATAAPAASAAGTDTIPAIFRLPRSPRTPAAFLYANKTAVI